MFQRAEDGAAAIEFGLVAIPFLALLLFMIEIGIMLVTEYSIQNGVEQASRIIRVSGQGTMSGEELLNEVCDRAAIVGNCETRLGLSVTSAEGFADVDTPLIADVAPGGVTNFNPGPPGDAVVIVATYDWEFITPFLRPLANDPANPDVRRLHGITTFRTELLE